MIRVFINNNSTLVFGMVNENVGISIHYTFGKLGVISIIHNEYELDRELHFASLDDIEPDIFDDNILNLIPKHMRNDYASFEK